MAIEFSEKQIQLLRIEHRNREITIEFGVEFENIGSKTNLADIAVLALLLGVLESGQAGSVHRRHFCFALIGDNLSSSNSEI